MHIVTIRLFALALLGLVALPLSAQRAQAAEIIVAGGCFWCVEADFEKVRGVREAVSGYTGGKTANPTYKQVSRGGTGHYEAAKITFDPGTVSTRQLYDLFFRSVDPLDAGGQFCDRGESYRTAIFYLNADQKAAAEAAKADAEKALGKKIVTPILPAKTFYVAEDYHQDYYKGKNRVVTRFGIIKQKDAYKRYREGCQRDQRIKQLWGNAAPFVN